MKRIVLALLFIPAIALAQGASCTDTITRLADPPSGGLRYTATVTCNQIIPSLLIGISGWVGTSADGNGIGACYNASTCTIYQTLVCAPPGTYDIRAVYMIDGVNFLYGQSVDTVTIGSGVQLSVRFEPGQTPGYARTYVDYYIPQQIYPHELLIYTFLGGAPVFFSSGTLGSIGTWQVPQDLPNGVNITVSAGVCNSDVSGDVMTTVQIPGTIEFSVTDQATEAERRVLLSNLESGYPYPHFQSLGGQDGKVPMYLRTRDGNGQLQSGTQVYLRVVDPPDTAPYMNLPQNQLAHDNDNVGPPATITGNGISGTTVPGVYQAVSGANGIVEFTLNLQPGTAAGDNYRVEASFTANFPPGTSWKSGTLTAWKRIFIEKHKMLRNGIFLTADAPPGTSIIHVADNHYGGNQGRHRISRGDRIVLVHAPASDGRDWANGWYREEHDVADVTSGASNDYVVTLGTRNGNAVTPQPVAHMFRPDPSVGANPALADTIANLTGPALSASDYFDAPDTLITGNLFTEAFVEYIVLPDGPSGFVPMSHFGTTVQPLLQQFADKWSRTHAGTSAAPNHQLLVVGDSDMSVQPDATGLTVTFVASQMSSWIWRGTIESLVGANHRNAGQADLWASKTAVHELAHEFKSNAVFNLGDHCPQLTPVYNDPTVYCLLADLDINGLVQAQRTNGIARFHLMQPTSLGGAWHSEYLEIRKNPDPFLP